MVLKTSLLALVVLGVACGTAEVVDEPVWTADDARAAMRDFLVSTTVVFNRNDLEYLDSASQRVSTWQSNYAGEGWWEVSGYPLGWKDIKQMSTPVPTKAPRQFTVSPTPCPTPDMRLLPTPNGIERSSSDITTSLVETMVRLICEGEQNPSPQVIPTPHLITIREYTGNGIWRVSERTGSVIANNHAATELYRCLVTTSAC